MSTPQAPLRSSSIDCVTREDLIQIVSEQRLELASLSSRIQELTVDNVQVRNDLLEREEQIIAQRREIEMLQNNNLTQRKLNEDSEKSHAQETEGLRFMLDRMSNDLATSQVIVASQKQTALLILKKHQRESRSLRMELQERAVRFKFCCCSSLQLIDDLCSVIEMKLLGRHKAKARGSGRTNADAVDEVALKAVAEACTREAVASSNLLQESLRQVLLSIYDSISSIVPR